MNGEENISDLIPQKPPFVMTGRLLYTDGATTRSSFVIAADNILMEHGIFSEGGLIENIAQTAAAGAGYIARLKNLPPAAGFIGAIKNLEITGVARTHDELITEVKIENQVFDATLISGRIWCSGKLITACEMTIFVRNSE